MNWIYQHREVLQALSSLTIACLTVVLIILTALYARANWRVMRLMEADLRFRTLPILRLGIESHLLAGQQHNWNIEIGNRGAPCCILAIRVTAIFSDRSSHTDNAAFNVPPILTQTEEYHTAGKLPPHKVPIEFWTTLRHGDLIGAFEYEDSFRGNDLYSSKIVKRPDGTVFDWLRRRATSFQQKMNEVESHSNTPT